jgi:hypothetical protein
MVAVVFIHNRSLNRRALGVAFMFPRTEATWMATMETESAKIRIRELIDWWHFRWQVFKPTACRLCSDGRSLNL